MNPSEPEPDPLEQRLSRQPFRALPSEWREEVLRSVRAAVPSAGRRASTTPGWWRSLLWPNPVAWAGLASVWVATLALNHAGRWEPAVPVATRHGSSAGLGIALIEHRRQLNELLDTPAAEPAPVPPPAPRPSGPRGALSRTNRLA